MLRSSVRRPSASADPSRVIFLINFYDEAEYAQTKLPWQNAIK
jgi:hypothetical protein